MNFLEIALSCIFPPVCGICGRKSKTYLCENCIKQLEKERKFLPKIEEKLSKYIVEHCYLFTYEGIIREKILQYKFHDKVYLANMFFEFFVKNEKVCGFLKKYDIIIPVPMSNKKIAQRGYNQSELVARKISKYTAIPIEKQVLLKQKDNQIQSSLNKKQRLENVKNVYKIQNEQKIKEKAVLLFDDIYTTGATRRRMCKSFISSRGKESWNTNYRQRL